MKIFLLLFCLISVNAFAETKDGDAKINMIQPLTLIQTQVVDFGDIATDGAGTVYMSGTRYNPIINCSGFDSHSCPKQGTHGLFLISGKRKTSVSLSIVNNGILANENGAVLTFVPELSKTITALNWKGERKIKVGGTIDLDGNQDAGDYSTTNSGGVPFQISVVY
ncbi:MAG: DUF4402 domain-containing protein [Alphaproteobacteria bacterium]